MPAGKPKPDDDLTDDELDWRNRRDKPLRPRRRELEIAGYVRDTGVRRSSLTSGMLQIVWALTEKGRDWAVRL